MTTWVVVGGGSAGCVVAARLSQDPSNRVTLLEAGPDLGGICPPPGDVWLDDPSRLVSHRVTRRVGEPTDEYVLGRGLGGSSAVNAGVVVDPERWVGGHDLPILPVDHPGRVGSAVLAATPEAAPVGLVGSVGRPGARVTAADAYLRPAQQRPNLTIRCDVDAATVEFEGRRCVGVVTSAGEQLPADRVVLCAGPVGSPALLLRSGVTTPGVGRGLQDHVGVLIPFDRTRPADGDHPTIGVTVERPGRQIVVLERLNGRDDVGALLAGHLAVASTGSVTVAGLHEAPSIDLRQLGHPADVDGLALVVTEALDLLECEPLRSLVGEVHVDPGVRSDVVRWVRDLAPLSGYHHLAGSCRIGAALGADGWLHGYERLAVCDASALAGVPSRNPYLAVVLQAERMAAAWSA